MVQVLCPIVVGRDPELALLDEHLSAARAGSGSVVFLVGEAGIGKSRLTREAEARAGRLGMTVLRGRAVQAAAPIPFRPLAEAVHGAIRTDAVSTAPQLEPYRRALGRLVPEWSEDQGAPLAEAAPLLLLEGALHLLRCLAASTGLLVVLEDLHWADADTLAAVEYLSDHLGSEHVLCLCTVRADEAGPGARLAETLSARRTAVRLALARLSDQETGDMVRASLGEKEPPQSVLEAVRARAEGVPFLVEELLSAYEAAGRPVDEDSWARALPPSYRDLVRDRLATLSGEGRRVVFAAAVLGRSFEWSLLGSIVEADPEAVLARLRGAVEAQLVQAAGAGTQVAFGFRHALVRQAVLQELLPPERAELSLRAADAIEERFPGLPGEWCERAAALREDGGDPLGAARLLLEAGRRALARTALASAEATLERGRALAAGDPWLRWGMGHVLQEALALMGKIDRVRELGEELVPFVERSSAVRFWPHMLAPVHLRIARGVAAAGDLGLARAHLDRARMAARTQDDAVQARIAAFGARIALEEGDLEEAAREAERSLATAERLGLHDVSSESLEVGGMATFRGGDVGEARRILRRAAEVAEQHGLDLWRARALVALGTIERCTTAELGPLMEARAVVGVTEAVSTHARIDLEIGRTLTARFERASALEVLERCVSACRRYRLPLLPRALVAQAAVLALLPRETDMEPLIEEALGLDPDAPGLLAEAWGGARAILDLVVGERARAVDELETAIRHARRAPASDPRSWSGLWALLRSVEDGGAEARAEVASSWDAPHRATQGYLAFAESVELGRGGRAEEAARRFRSADRTMRPFPWDRHLGRLLAVEASARDGWGEPAGWMAETLPFFEAAGHQGPASASRRVLRELGVPVPRRGRGRSDVPPGLRALGVTSREMDVLGLVVEGLSNPKIAERLYLSRRTVESHVASLLRKTGAATRDELSVVAGRAE